MADVKTFELAAGSRQDLGFFLNEEFSLLLLIVGLSRFSKKPCREMMINAGEAKKD